MQLSLFKERESGVLTKKTYKGETKVFFTASKQKKMAEFKSSIDKWKLAESISSPKGVLEIRKKI